jgi:hypothetical protein
MNLHSHGQAGMQLLDGCVCAAEERFERAVEQHV